MRHAVIAIRDPRWCASWRAAVALVLLCLAVYVPGFTTLPVVDRDEARFAQASRQMFEAVALPPGARDPAMHAGGAVIPMVQDRPRLNKPPLIYWLQAASAAVLTGGEPARDAVWMYRVPSLLAAIATVLLTWRLGLSMFDPRAAFLAGVILAVCPLFVWEARQSRADHLLTACTTLAMLALWRVWRASLAAPASGSPQPRAVLGWAVLLWVAITLGALAKGPITLMVALLTIASLGLLTREWAWTRTLRPVLGLAILAAGVVPWIALVANQYGTAKYLALVYDETLGRAGSPRENHFGPPGYHLVLLIVTLWPGSIVTGMAVLRAWTRTIRGARPWKWRSTVRTRSRSAELFCLAWVLPSWIVFELVATKLPHYTMPLMPALALLSARTLLAVSAGSVKRAWGRLQGTVYILWLGVSAAIGVVAFAASLLFFDTTWAGPVGVAMGGAAVLLGVQVWMLVRASRSLASRRIARALRAGVSIAVITWVAVLGIILPRTPSLWATQRVMASLRSIDPEGQRPVATLYREDSVVFETRGRVVRASNAGQLAEFLRATPGGLGIVRERDMPGIPGAAALAFIRGFNIARFARERLVIVEQAAPQPAEPLPVIAPAEERSGGREP